MQTTEINLKVPSEIAKVYKTISPENQMEIIALVSSLLKPLTIEERKKNLDNLESNVIEISQQAQKNGLTPEILEKILNEE